MCDEIFDNFLNDDPYHREWDEESLENAEWNYDRFNPAHNPKENPLIDVFGPGEEAETAFWNTD